MNENPHIIEWAWNLLVGAIGAVSVAFTTVVWWLFRRHIVRLEAVEAELPHAITRPQVEIIVREVEEEFKREHRNILDQMRNDKMELAQAMRENTQTITDRIDRLVDGRNGKRRR